MNRKNEKAQRKEVAGPVKIAPTPEVDDVFDADRLFGGPVVPPTKPVEKTKQRVGVDQVIGPSSSTTVQVKIEPQIFTQLSSQVQDLLSHKDWQSNRQEIESVFVKLKDPDIAVQKEAQLDIDAIFADMQCYRNGNVGEKKKVFGKYAMMMIEELKKGIDPTSPQYRYMYVDGIHPSKRS